MMQEQITEAEAAAEAELAERERLEMEEAVQASILAKEKAKNKQLDA